MTRQPAFYAHDGSRLAACALLPAAVIYDAAARLRFRLTSPRRAGVPVICVGNPTLGGAGKTPVAIAIAERLKAMGRNPAFLSRGYGARVTGPLTVTGGHRAADVGDEPLLLARTAPTVVSPDRPAGAAQAIDQGADVIVMDDGFQNPTLAKDLSILVIDGPAGLGNGFVFPACPLRMSFAHQRARADALVIIGDDSMGVAEHATCPVLRAAIAPDDAVAASLSGEKVVAFAGIGRPEKVFDTLTEIGAEIVARHAFPDHHVFTGEDARTLLSEAALHSARLVTTEKDMARLKGADDGVIRDLAETAMALPVHIRFEPGSRSALDALLASLIRRGG